ncbi:hypothetical protein EW146_g5508 [Bondarzewia mesenterica]|uniref:PIN domain-containing protein n=1 Tax=Bondarzewia mesenterica TaxID=1095465 RepID=A0A4S4LRW3_9AGAM|nr:hypothetical protein EW146_g5508 [Bondarzewia mesenterica]
MALENEQLRDVTLRRVESEVNSDVDMQAPPSPSHVAYLVLDTNVLLDHLDALQQFVSDVESMLMPVVVVIPGVVLSELDGQKNRPGLAWSARRASTWLLKKVKERRSVRGQTHEETCKRSGKWNVLDLGEVRGSETNDDLIMDCCQYFCEKLIPGHPAYAILCSSDKNLCIKCESKGIRSYSPSHTWNSREMAKFIFQGLDLDFSRFDSYPTKVLRHRAGTQREAALHHDDDMMDIDDAEDIYMLAPSHPLDALHLEVIDHFSPLLLELVDRVGGSSVPRTQEEAAELKSVHAPSWTRVRLWDWTPAMCLECLTSSKKPPQTVPGLDVFLLKPYHKDACGTGRRGQDWTKAQWTNAQEALEKIGNVWEDGPILESAVILKPRRTLHICLFLLALILLGTVIVLSSVSYYLSIPDAAYLTEDELDAPFNSTAPWNATEHGKLERIPRILHQTWKSETLPDRWKGISEECREMMPDYEYMLWTDASAREFVADKYHWFLDTFDSYTYPIQRADAIRYFVLHHYGGVYLDLDIGCLRRLDPLLVYPVILPRTIPVGVSNDLMFAEKGHPFLAQTIHNLVTFDHNWVLNYPTVMFSTGPMFLSAQYGLYSSSHPVTPEKPDGGIRVLPKSLYGKNAKPEEAPHSFFTHYYGSSWHADDAAFIGFLGKWGKGLMWVGLAVLVFGIVRLLLTNSKQRNYSLPRIGGYEVLLPRWVERSGRWHLDLGWISLPGRPSPSATPIISQSVPSGIPDSPSSGSEEEMGLLPLSLDARPDSPTDSEFANPSTSAAADAVRRVRDGVASFFGLSNTETRSPARSRRRPRGVLFFLPAFASRGDISLPSHESTSDVPAPIPRTPPSLTRSLSRFSSYLPDKQGFGDVEEGIQSDLPPSPSGSRLPPYTEEIPAYGQPFPDAIGSRRPYINLTPTHATKRT